MTEDFKCPKCKAPASKFEKIEEAAPVKNPYAGTKTEKNLWEAFAGESQARNKYTYFASVAKKAGYEQIAAPAVCPVCNHPQAYFEVRKENYGFA